ncbi:MAG: CDP-glycerol glycerophosphotransferase family protein [Arcobacteraceae bacterium]
MDLNHKKIYIAPHTPKTTMFIKELKKAYPHVIVLGFLDKTKEGKDIFKIETIQELFDYILILSPNHFDSIYNDYANHKLERKVIKAETIQNQYHLFSYDEIQKIKQKNIPDLIKKFVYKQCVLFFNLFHTKRKQIVFISQSFLGTNNKMLYLACIKNHLDVTLLTDNEEHLKELKKRALPCARLNSLCAYYSLSKAKTVVQDQGNSNHLLPFLSPLQMTIQLWHGLPLKRMNKLADVMYDYHISTSDFVNDTSLSDVIPAKQHLDLGYPRNDLLLKTHEPLDLLLVDLKIYTLAKENKVIVYMPTHRESEPSFENQASKKLPLDLGKLNAFMQKHHVFFILKLHPFVSKLYKNENFSHILFYEPQNDIYPVLKYTDILITDYSSVYYDFLLLNRPIVFFDYDYEEYSSNMNGFVYDYEENALGKKVKTQAQLEESLEEILQGEEIFKEQRKTVLNKFFTYQDDNSSQRVIDTLCKNGKKDFN